MSALPASLFEGMDASVLRDTHDIIGRTMIAADALLLRDLAARDKIPLAGFELALLFAHLCHATTALRTIYRDAEPEDLAGLVARFVRETLADAAAMGAVSLSQ